MIIQQQLQRDSIVAAVVIIYIHAPNEVVEWIDRYKESRYNLNLQTSMQSFGNVL